MFDIPILGSLFFSNFPKYISKRSLGRWIPSVSYNLRRGGHVLIDRSDAPGALDAIRALGRQVRAGGASAMIFPEGTRARVGELGRFKPAGTLALLEEAPETPIVPVAIDESWRLLQHNFLPVPWGVRVRVHIGAPIARQAGEDGTVLLEHVRDEIDVDARRLARRSAVHGRRARVAARLVTRSRRCPSCPTSRSTSRRCSRASSASGSSACGCAARSCCAPSSRR